jgi:3-oxoacyl-[acyl-carrier protein] reductase
MVLKGKVALVTGGSRGIGRAIALGFAREGASIVVNYVADKQSAEKVVKMINEKEGKATAIQADIAHVKEVKKVLRSTCEIFGKINILVNNAAIVRPDLAINITEKDWDDLINVNLKGSFFCSQVAARIMIKQSLGGRIINISSINSQRAEPYYSSYTASKGGLESLTRTLASELGPYGITVNAVSPGAVLTSIVNIEKSEKAMKEKEKTIPIGKLARPEDIVPAVIFFASDASWYVTGQVLQVDGGSFINANRKVNWVD